MGSIYFSIEKKIKKDQTNLVNGTKVKLSKREELAIKWILENGLKMPDEKWEERSWDHWNAVSLIADIQHEPINREAYKYLFMEKPPTLHWTENLQMKRKYRGASDNDSVKNFLRNKQ